MQVLSARNVHEALPRGLKMIMSRGVRQESRNGPVMRVPEPVTTVYEKPCERVEFHPWRDANPFFHFYESLWMLAGREDVRPLTRYVGRMASFSDDDEKFNAAYGHRWRHALRCEHGNADHVGRYVTDQLPIICDALRKNPDDRQQVLQIWDHRLDLGTQTKDHACNLTATFQIVDSRMNMVVFCRSNDAVWGAYGANAVHFSMLLEYVARRTGCGVGTYSQVSVNLHAYVDNPVVQLEREWCDAIGGANPYVDGRFMDPSTPIASYPIAEVGTDFARWDLDCRCFVTADGQAPTVTARRDYLPFFRDVAWPIVQAHDLYKAGAIGEAISVVGECAAPDWRLACTNWLLRRQSRKLRGAEKSVVVVNAKVVPK